MTVFRIIGLAAYLACISACTHAGAAVAGPPATLTYDLLAASLPVARVELTLEADGGAYRVGSTLRTTGLAELRAAWRAAPHSRGRLVDGAIRPQYHSNDGEWRPARRSVRLTYYPDDSVAAEIEPPAAAESRLTVSAAARAGTIDLMSAFAQLAYAGSPEAACAGTRHIFDGRRRYDLRLTADCMSTLTPQWLDVHARAALRCLVSVRYVAGFPDSGDGFAVPARILPWLVRSADASLVVPVRLQAASPYGQVMVYLTNISIEERREARAD